MGHSAEKRYAETWIAGTWRHDVLSSFDVVGVLSASLTPGWYVERTVDPSGDIAIVVLPAGDGPEQLSFVLYETDGLVEVGTIAGETWRGSRQLPSCQHAVAAIIAASALVCSS